MEEYALQPVLALLLAGPLLLAFMPPAAPAVAGMPRTKARRRHTTCRACRQTLVTEAVDADRLLADWGEHMRGHCTDDTVKLNVGTVEAFLSFVKKALERIKRGDLDAWLARNKRVLVPGGRYVETDEPIAGSTRRNNEDAVCRFFAWATDQGKLRTNPFARRRRTPAPEGPERYIPRAQVRKLIAAATALGDGGRMLVMLRLAFDAGFRRGAIAAARLEDIRWGEGVIGVRGKGGGGAVTAWIPMSAELRAVLAAWTAGRRAKTGPLLPSLGPRNRGGHMSTNYVGTLISQFMHAHGVDETAHGLRHTAGKEIAAVEDNVRAAQIILDHKSITTTERVYLRGARSAAWRAVEGRPPLSEDFDVMGPPIPRRVGSTGHFPGLGDRTAGGPRVLGNGDHQVARRQMQDAGDDDPNLRGG